jgi:hypothetical protein
MAFRTQKISQMTPKGSDLEATDLIEVSTIESGSYVTRSITGQELIDAIPPTTIEWGDIGGTLSNQTDLNTALNARVPTSRTLTINGTTQDLSANRTFTIPTNLTVGTTPIASGTIGRVLFQGTGNVLQQSSSLFWDSTNNRLGIGTSSPANLLSIVSNLNASTGINLQNTNSSSSAVSGLNLISDSAQGSLFAASSTYTTYGVLQSSSVGFYTNKRFAIAVDANEPFVIGLGSGNPSEKFRINSNGNVLINTTTDAGFRLDVNGTARVSGVLTIANASSNISGGASGLALNATFFTDFQFTSGGRLHRLASNQFGINSFIGNNIAIGYDPTGSSPASAKIELGAGTATAGTAPLKLRSGTNLTTPENGAFEFDGTNLYFTVGGVRKIVTLL